MLILDDSQRKTLREYLDCSERSLRSLGLPAGPLIARVQVQQYKINIRLADSLVRAVADRGTTKDIHLRMGQRSAIERVIHDRHEAAAAAEKLLDGALRKIANLASEFFAAISLYLAVLQEILLDHEFRTANLRQGQELKPHPHVRMPTPATHGRMSMTRLYRLISRVECRAFCGAPISWAGEVVYGTGGWLVHPEWHTTDAITGEPCKCTGAKFYVSPHAADNEVVQALLRSAIAAAEHEVRESFHFEGVAIYRPHQPLEALRDFTAAHAPETRNPPGAAVPATGSTADESGDHGRDEGAA